MEVIKAVFSETKGIPPSGLCVGVHRAGAIQKKMVEKYGEGLAVWSLRPDQDFVAFKKEGLGEKGIRTTNDMESIREEKLIYGVRGAPPQIRQKAREQGLEPDEGLYGLYEGIPRTDWGADGFAVPNRIVLFRLPLEADYPDPDDLADEVWLTVVHELAHHLGIEEDRLAELGVD